ncbi:PfaD family polyunsaturated fatty acid/polyketide biosynthesis protein [Anabaena sp. CS-542/02]|uniref:PfaD family polyunsaturated fatty acid/polyketide biosynthesis protein n=1 Tax=Anabaena sp. CS-542/02 TaxID=3021719 RepID=UPI00232EC271|nr:PfaD family polyunsaturated fatty acid/polyketide biosynthesis protein [Anabaena sp. CS-542/02]MDB9447351.1 PfaD family polyunsaturated fatty acid/polyketide biosynthesis protein [Anabaena sp. CS-542/02]
MMNNNLLSYKRENSLLKTSNFFVSNRQAWHGDINTISFDGNGIRAKLINLAKPCYIIRVEDKIGVTNEGELIHYPNSKTGQEMLMSVPPMQVQQLGDPKFLDFHNVKYAYATGSMAHGIASEELVIALGKEKILSSFGAGGLSPDRVEAAIKRIQQALPEGIYAFNLLHSPSEPTLERGTIDLYLKYQVRTIEASAFLDLTDNVVYYRVAGLGLNAANQIQIKNKVIAKVSRREVATKFLEPAPVKILKRLVQQGLISELQASIAAKVPMADDITVEADSGGHTDNRPLVCLLPSILELRDQIQGQYGYERPVRIGVAGGIATPQSVLAGFMMGAAYVVTGSINQSCIEAGTSEYTKQLLAQADMADVIMAPAADMFEMGVKLQVLKRGTLFPLRAQKLFDLYKNYDSIEDIPVTEREKIEKQIFRNSLDSIWQETVNYLSQRHPEKLHKAANNPKLKMALIFRWYLALSSHWSNSGEKGREIDYQIWCGPSMGSFNNWIQGSYLADLNNRKVVDVAHHMMIGAAFLYRLQNLKIQGLQIPDSYTQYHPVISGKL